MDRIASHPKNSFYLVVVVGVVGVVVCLLCCGDVTGTTSNAKRVYEQTETAQIR